MSSALTAGVGAVPSLKQWPGLHRGEKALSGREIYGPSVITSWLDFNILTPPMKGKKQLIKEEKRMQDINQQRNLGWDCTI